MNDKDFKMIFEKIARKKGFEKAFGGWFKEGSECVTVIELQKSNFEKFYRVIIKIYIQGMFGNNYMKSKNMVKKNNGDIFRGHPTEYDSILNLEVGMEDEEREKKIEELFDFFIVPFTDEARTIEGLFELSKQDQIYLLPAVKQELDVLRKGK